MRELSELHNVEVERSLLAAILTDNHRIEVVIDIVSRVMFYDEHNAILWDIIIDGIESNRAVSLQTAKIALERKGVADVDSYLSELACTNIFFVKDIEGFANSIREYYLLRNISRICDEGFAYIRGKDNLPIEKIIPAIEEKLYQISDSKETKVSTNDVLHRILSNIKERRDNPNEFPGIKTGFVDIDNFMYGGLSNSDLVIIAARPSMGKTSLALSMAFNMAKIGKHVAFFSLEMSSEQLLYKVISMDSGVPISDLRKGTIDNFDLTKITKSMQTIRDLNLYIDDASVLDIATLRIQVRRMKRKHGLDCLFIDYLQLISCVAYKESRLQEVSAISRGLKAIAKELDIPVIALSQLSRAVEGRDDKKPQLSDLRESGTIEQDSDIVMFLYRECYYMERNVPPDTDNERFLKWQEKISNVKNVADVMIAKNRNGPIGTKKLHFNDKSTKFSNSSQQHHASLPTNQQHTECCWPLV